MGKQLPFRLILASGSPARRNLLHKAGYDFQVIPADVEEPTQAGFALPDALVEHIAWLKANAVFRQMLDPRPALILAADTIAWLIDQAIGKPADLADARRILRRLMGTEHELWTGVCCWLWP